MAWTALGSVLSFAGALGPYIFLAVLLFVIGSVLTLLGFDLAEVDLWLEGHGGLFNAIGSALIRLFCGLVLLVCIVLVSISVWSHGARFHEKYFKAEVISTSKRKADKVKDAPAGCLGIGVLLVIGYFAFFGAFSNY